MTKPLLIAYLCCILAAPARSEPSLPTVGGDLSRPEGKVLTRKPAGVPAQEFFSEIYPGEILVSVKVLGAVKSAGIYHIPKRTDLVTLLALAGGLAPNADDRQVVIKRRSRDEETVTVVDLSRIMTTAGAASPFLETDDVVLVETDEPVVSQQSLTLVGFIASIFSLIISGVVLSNMSKK